MYLSMYESATPSRRRTPSLHAPSPQTGALSVKRGLVERPRCAIAADRRLRYVTDPGRRLKYVTDPGRRLRYVTDPGRRLKYVTDPGRRLKYVTDPGRQDTVNEGRGVKGGGMNVCVGGGGVRGVKNI